MKIYYFVISLLFFAGLGCQDTAKNAVTPPTVDNTSTNKTTTTKIPFVGKWISPDKESLLEVKKSGETFQIIWKNHADMFLPKKFDLELIDGKLILEKEEQKVKINYNTENTLEILMDDNPEFAPIKAILEPSIN